jgi:hypothetical protein
MPLNPAHGQNHPWVGDALLLQLEHHFVPHHLRIQAQALCPNSHLGFA